MKLDEELFNITPEEAKFVQELIDQYIKDQEELRDTTGEDFAHLPYDSYLEQCETENGQVCFRTNMAVTDLGSFLMTDGDASLESMEAEFSRLERHFELFQTSACQTMVYQLMAMSSLMHTAADYAEDAQLVDRDFARTRLADFLQQGSLGKPRLSEAILKFIESQS